MKTFLFQGDSITDCGRPAEHDIFFGNGYPTLVASRLGYEFPGSYRFINRGIGGNRIADLYARIKIDILSHRPDIMTLLIGINDIHAEVFYRNGTDIIKFKKIYTMLLEELKETLPNLKILIIGPFICENLIEEPYKKYFTEEFPKREAAVAEVAGEFNLPFLPLQQKFIDAFKLAPPDYWFHDGLHPKPAGHGLIAEELISSLKKNRII